MGFTDGVMSAKDLGALVDDSDPIEVKVLKLKRKNLEGQLARLEEESPRRSS